MCINNISKLEIMYGNNNCCNKHLKNKIKHCDSIIYIKYKCRRKMFFNNTNIEYKQPHSITKERIKNKQEVEVADEKIIEEIDNIAYNSIEVVFLSVKK